MLSSTEVSSSDSYLPTSDLFIIVLVLAGLMLSPFYIRIEILGHSGTKLSLQHMPPWAQSDRYFMGYPLGSEIRAFSFCRCRMTQKSLYISSPNHYNIGARKFRLDPFQGHYL